ncbi:MAG: hypothetical protein WC766_02615 [Patescibacteria group bacterium]|jgi:hypothetical protein
MTAGDFWKRSVGFGVSQSDADWIVIQDPAVFESHENLPWELRYILSLRPSRHATVSNLLKQGFGLGFVTHKAVPDEVVRSVRRISDLTQEGMAHLWLEKLVKYGQDPVWTSAEAKDAEAQGIDLKTELLSVKNFGNNHCRLALMQFADNNSAEANASCLQEMNDDLVAVSAPWLFTILREKLAAFKFPIAAICLSSLFITLPLTLWLQNILPSAIPIIAALVVTVVLALRTVVSPLRVQASLRRGNELLWLFGVLCAVVLPVFFVANAVDSADYFFAGSLFALSLAAMPVYLLAKEFVKAVKAWRRLTSSGKIAYSGDPLAVACGREKDLLARLAGVIAAMLMVVWFFVMLGATSLTGFWPAILACFPYVLAEFFGWLETQSAKAAYAKSLKRLWRKAIILTSEAW